MPSDWPGVEEFFDGLERVLRSRIGGNVQSRISRLTASDDADYRSAMDELSVAACLVGCGFDVTLGSPNPDITARRGGHSLAIELATPRRTAEIEALLQLASFHWRGPGFLSLRVGRDTYRPTSHQRSRIVGKAMEAAAERPTERKQVDLASIGIDGATLTAEIHPNLPPGVAIGNSDFGGRHDVLADIDSVINSRDKRKQLRGAGDIVVAVDLARLSADPYTWALRRTGDARLTAAVSEPGVTTLPNVVGVLAFIPGTPGRIPILSVWVENSAHVDPDPELLHDVRYCLGSPPVSVPAPPSNGLG